MFRQDEILVPERARSAPSGGRAGLIRNRRSRRNRNLPAGPWWRDLAEPDLLRADPDGPEELVQTLRDFARREVGLLVIDGGDGTVREVLTALPRAYGDAPPALAVLAQGATNLIAADVGAGRAEPAVLTRLTRCARHGAPETAIVRRPVLEVVWPDGSHPPAAGMFLGAGAFTRATGLSERLVRRGVLHQGAGVAATLISSLVRTFLAPQHDHWQAGDPMGLAPRGEAYRHGPRLIVLATTLHRLMLGLWPFWGEGEGGLRYLDIDAPPRRFAAAVPAVLHGRPRPWMEAAGYRSGVCPALELSLSVPFILDGELFEPGPAGRVVVRAGRSLDFIVP